MPPNPHQRRSVGNLDPAIRQILQYAHPVDPAGSSQSPSSAQCSTTETAESDISLSGPMVTYLSGVYIAYRSLTPSPALKLRSRRCRLLAELAGA